MMDAPWWVGIPLALYIIITNSVIISLAKKVRGLEKKTRHML